MKAEEKIHVFDALYNAKVGITLAEVIAETGLSQEEVTAVLNASKNNGQVKRIAGKWSLTKMGADWLEAVKNAAAQAKSEKMPVVPGEPKAEVKAVPPGSPKVDLAELPEIAMATTAEIMPSAEPVKPSSEFNSIFKIVPAIQTADGEVHKDRAAAIKHHVEMQLKDELEQFWKECDLSKFMRGSAELGIKRFEAWRLEKRLENGIV